MGNIKLLDLETIPYLDVANLQGRFLSTLAFYVNDEWSFWFPTNKGLQKAKAWPAESCYYGDKPELDNDIYLHFLDFLSQRANFSQIQKPLSGLIDDFFNLSTSLAKINLFYKERESIKTGVSRMVSTEIEFIFSVCRSIFDLLQEIISKLWSTIKLTDTTTTKNQLPEEFSKIISTLNKNTDNKCLTEKYGLPTQLADFYSRNLDFFSSLRSYRDNIIHRGSSVDIIFSTDKGFAVQETQKPFADYNIWTEDHKQKNGLCSLRPAIGYVIHRTISICEDFSKTIENMIVFPPESAPNLHLYIRGYFNEQLIKNTDVINNSQWWDT